MGLIKTAIYGGAGLYAINRFAKVAENREGSRTHDKPHASDSHLLGEVAGGKHPRRSSYDMPRQGDWTQADASGSRDPSRWPPAYEQGKYWYSPHHDAWYPYPPEYQSNASMNGASSGPEPNSMRPALPAPQDMRESTSHRGNTELAMETALQSATAQAQKQGGKHGGKSQLLNGFMSK